MQNILNNEIIIIIIRLSLIVFLSGIIGFERELKNHPAGLRTHILVGVGSCLLMLLSLYGFESYLTIHPQVTRYDPSRIPSYVISGIGFLGAGSIIIYGGVTVKGLTTAASIWTVAGLGLVVGVGMYFESVLATVIIITTLLFLDKLEEKIELKFKKKGKHQKQFLITIEIDKDMENLFKINMLLLEKDIEVETLNMEINHFENKIKYTFKVNAPNSLDFMSIIETLQGLSTIYRVQVQRQS